MEFSIRARSVQRVSDPDRLKAEYRAYLVSGARAVLRLFTGGRLLSQVLEGSGFRIWFHDFFIEEPVSLFVLPGQRLSTLHYALAGDVKWAPMEDEAHLLQEGRYYLLKVLAGAEQILFPDPGIFRIFQVDFSASFPDVLPVNIVAEDMLPYGLDRVNNVVSCGLNDYRVMTAISRIRESQLTGRAEQDFFLSGRIMDLLQLHARHLALKSQSSAYAAEKKIEAIQDYIQTHLEVSLSISGLCQQFRITKSVLQKYFKQHAKQPLHAYIRKQRMEYGLFLLQRGEKQVSEIALLTGYKDISGFRRAFKAYFGFPPSHVASNRDVNEWP